MEFKKGGAEGRERKDYHSFVYTTLKLFEHMWSTRERFSVRKLQKFSGVHVQRRDRIRESLGALVGLGLVRAIPGNPIFYEVTKEGFKAYPEAKRVLEFYDSIMFAREGFRDRRALNGSSFLNQKG